MKYFIWIIIYKYYSNKTLDNINNINNNKIIIAENVNIIEQNSSAKNNNFKFYNYNIKNYNWNINKENLLKILFFNWMIYINFIFCCIIVMNFEFFENYLSIIYRFIIFLSILIINTILLLIIKFIFNLSSIKSILIDTNFFLFKNIFLFIIIYYLLVIYNINKDKNCLETKNGTTYTLKESKFLYNNFSLKWNNILGIILIIFWIIIYNFNLIITIINYKQYNNYFNLLKIIWNKKSLKFNINDELPKISLFISLIVSNLSFFYYFYCFYKDHFKNNKISYYMNF
jgi:hypothetical protein